MPQQNGVPVSSRQPTSRRFAESFSAHPINS